MCERPAILSELIGQRLCHAPPHGEGGDLGGCSGTAPPVRAQLRPDELTARQAAAYLELSARQVLRLLAAYRCEAGAVGARLVELATNTDRDVNRALVADLLTEREGMAVPERTARRALAEARMPAVRRARSAAVASGIWWRSFDGAGSSARSELLRRA